ncbi:hypothetical protein BGZ60DRAFT_438349 [Tricladium varicosporioides]|nr:hypothetical protein BGZ60DRAFT_438349 [Hymenoscyphus varicosporioides]
MQFSTILVSSIFAAVAIAQNATSVTSSLVVSGTQAITPAQSTQASCLAACNPRDTACLNACIVAPSGTVNPIISCISSCSQGDGSSSANAAYLSCQKNCLSAATVTSTSAAATGTGTGAGTVTGSAGVTTSAGTATGTAAGGVSTGSGTATSSSAAKSSSAAAENVRVGASVAGAFGLFAAIFAL